MDRLLLFPTLAPLLPPWHSFGLSYFPGSSAYAFLPRHPPHLDHTISTNLANVATSCVPLDPDFRRHIIPVFITLARRVGWLLSPGGQRCREVFFSIYH